MEDQRPELSSILERARAAWPAVRLTDADFLAHVTPKLPEGEPIEQALQQVHATDLFLAAACVQGDPAAQEAFDRHCAPVIDRALARIEGASDLADEVRQRVRELVLLPHDGAPRIGDFSGKSELASWVRVIAVREALKIVRARQRHLPAEDDQLADLLEPDSGPELQYFKKLYRQEFRAALYRAIESLSDRQRLILRQNALDGLSIDRLAALHGVHRATAARWIQSAKEDLLANTRRTLLERLQVSPPELDSILKLIESQLEASLHPLLAEPSDQSG